MSKTVRINVSELVWQSRHLDWNEDDYNQYLEYLKMFKDKQDGDWSKNNYRLYEFLSPYTWDQIVEFMQADDERDTPKFTYINHYYNEKEYTYSAYIGDIIRDAMQEDVWDKDIDDYDSQDCQVDLEFYDSGDEDDD